VPAPAYACADCWVYPLLQGQPLDRIRVRRYDEATQGQLAGQLGVFLRQLHHIDISAASANIPNTHAPVSRSRWLEIQAAVRTQIYPLLQRFQVEYLDDLFDRALDDPQFFDYAPTLIHGDLASYHILFDPEQRQITGVIDFGMAGVGDPANDFGLLISIYGEAFVRRMRPAYPNLDHYLPRARFYAQGLELEWLLRGLDTGENFWFTAHIGGARDLEF
jgi:aminoglycoside 2''-phosphotransferase